MLIFKLLSHDLQRSCSTVHVLPPLPPPQRGEYQEPEEFDAGLTEGDWVYIDVVAYRQRYSCNQRSSRPITSLRQY